MQKKQVKIMGFQAENCKLKLYYETDGEEGRYIVEKNRKYEIISKDIWVCKMRLTADILSYINQTKLDI